MYNEWVNQQDQIDYWLISAAHDLETADSLFLTTRYDWALFIGHLVLEKTLKALYVKVCNDTPPRSHNLIYLLDKCEISIEEDRRKYLISVNDFNIEARYPDYKLSFYKLCTKEFTSQNLDQIKEVYQWLLPMIK